MGAQDREDRSAADSDYRLALRLGELPRGGCKLVSLAGHAIALFHTEEGIFALDNRCPHMGFPLLRGSVRDCILTCHWHHARFDLKGGGTFDPWADDARAFAVKLKDGAIFVDVAERALPLERRLARLREGLERGISLVIAKAVLKLKSAAADGGGSDGAYPRAALRAGLEFGLGNRQAGWGSGLTTLTCMVNLLPYLEAADRPLALFHGLSDVADDSAGSPPRFALEPLPGAGSDLAPLARWFRQFVEVRDAEGAERCLVSAVRTGAKPAEIAAMMFNAASDHRYLTIGHVLDFTNKAFEALDVAGWDLAAPALASLAGQYAAGQRMEESNQWRHPVDLVAIVERAFEKIPAALASGRGAREERANGAEPPRAALVDVILGDDPQAIADALIEALKAGCAPARLAGTVAYAAALRVARFPVTNEFGDWDTAHHSFTFSSAVHRALLRAAVSPELVRAVLDAAMTVYLNRFLNVPAAPLAHPGARPPGADEMLAALPSLLDRQQRVGETGALVGEYLLAGYEPAPLIAALGRALLREDRDFHTIQELEAALSMYKVLGGGAAGAHAMAAAARYLAAHAPTVRAQGQTWRIAERLDRGETLFEEDEL